MRWLCEQQGELADLKKQLKGAKSKTRKESLKVRSWMNVPTQTASDTNDGGMGRQHTARNQPPLAGDYREEKEGEDQECAGQAETRRARGCRSGKNPLLPQGISIKRADSSVSGWTNTGCAGRHYSARTRRRWSCRPSSRTCRRRASCPSFWPRSARRTRARTTAGCRRSARTSGRPCGLCNIMEALFHTVNRCNCFFLSLGR